MAPGTRMRLTIEVLPLAAQDAHGPLRDHALAAFKGRKFALPVQLEDNFERVWAQIEQRYKNNYLNPIQAAAFTISKLQDAYDCDLDLGDTVGSIFESESDPAMRMIKVVPSFIDRAFSVPPTSNLLPPNLQKRALEINTEQASKRRRIEQFESPIRDRPLPSRESVRHREGSFNNALLPGSRAGSLSARSRSGGSLVFVHGVQTGQAEFAPSIKSESPELNVPQRTSVRSSSKAPRLPVQTERSQPEDSIVPDSTAGATEHGQGQAVTQETAPQVDAEGTATHRSPQLTPTQLRNTTPPSATERNDIYDLPSSPEFMLNQTKRKKTYSRSPRTIATVQKEVDLLNSSRFMSMRSKRNGKLHTASPALSSKKNRAFRNPEIDEIESTSQEDAASASMQRDRAESIPHSSDLTSAFLADPEIPLPSAFQTPGKRAPSKTAKSGGLKKPPKKTPSAVSAKADRNIQFGRTPGSTRKSMTPAIGSSGRTAGRLDPDIQARLDKIKSLRQQESSPTVDQHNSTQSQSVRNNSPLVNGEVIGTSPPAAPMESTPTTKGQPKSSSIASSTADRLSVQPSSSRKPPQRSPISVQSVKDHTPRTNVKCAFDSLMNNSGFQKPAIPTRATASEGRTNGTHQDKQGTSFDRRSTPLRSEIPLPANVRHLSNNSTQESQLDSVTTPQGQVSPAPLSTQRKRRGGSQEKQAANSTPTSERMPSDKITEDETLTEPPSENVPAAGDSIDDAIILPSEKPSEDVEDNEEHEVEDVAVNNSENAPKTIKRSRAGDDGPRTEQVAASDDADVQAVEAGGHDGAEQPSADISTASEELTEPKETVSSVKPWVTPSWGFGVSSQLNDTTESALDEDHINSHTTALTEKVSEGAIESEPEASPALDAHSKSRSASAAASIRSSPAVSRRPARFLSRSPTSEASASDAESGEPSPIPSKAASPNPTIEIESDSSESEEATTDEEEDVEMPDIVPDVAPASTADTTGPFPSSPPRLNVPGSTPLVPETSQAGLPQSQPQVRHTPIPLPSNVSPSLNSSRSASAQTALQKSNSRYTTFRSLRDQLTDAKSTPIAAQKKAYDPRMMDLSKLATKGKSKPALGVGLDDNDSSDEESSSSSDSD